MREIFGTTALCCLQVGCERGRAGSVRESGEESAADMRRPEHCLVLLAILAPNTAKEAEQGKLKVYPSENELVLRNFEDGTYK